MTKDTDEGLSPARSSCPISLAMEAFGDKWTLLLIRDMLGGKCRYKDFQDSPEKIPTNILASRLKRLENMGFVDRLLYQDKPKRYQYILKQRGKDIIPILQEITRWSLKHTPDCRQPPDIFWQLKP